MVLQCVLAFTSLGFAEFLECIGLYLSPDLGNLQPLFGQVFFFLISFFIIFFLLLFGGSNYMTVKFFSIVPQVSEVLFTYFCFW